MKLPASNIALATTIAMMAIPASAQEEESNMVKMCLMFETPSGHARSDPILNQECAADHVHTFYGPQNIHPRTNNGDLRDTAPNFSSSPWVENQSLYWHPSIYEVSTTDDGQKQYSLVSRLDTSAYYRWDNTVEPRTEAFPPNFRMIAFSNQEGADRQGDIGGSLLVECCQVLGPGEDDESCTTAMNSMVFPKERCDFLGIGFAMPTCWDASKGDGREDPIGHMTYTTNGAVNGPCPDGYRRLPQVQLLSRIYDYRGDIHDYVLSNEADHYHVDFMNGWRGLGGILDRCQPTGEDGYHPPCGCTQFMTPTANPAEIACEEDVKEHILDEEITEVVGALPRGTCEGADVIPKSWDLDPPFAASGSCGNNNNNDNDNDNNDNDNDNDNDTCEDDSAFLFKNEAGKDCNWLSGLKKKQKKKFCKKQSNGQKVKAWCPVTCDNCGSNGPPAECPEGVADDASYLFKNKANKGCSWVGKKSRKNPKICKKKDRGKKVSEWCPVSCKAC
eukprot:CAMPEP_0172389320 /NCGR_PEP_ID=MMETSP1061-20121228/6230_1 /TAXON_ID=37318 /ORGANISM="Pseudo-nitzschia pungens, Strain cf. pungens" /LENGTH=502 /DNA_ID=CAMNT_0013119439 /DNA_START=241 /DNA_END=1749 /DNA_ORIENTATION=+